MPIQDRIHGIREQKRESGDMARIMEERVKLETFLKTSQEEARQEWSRGGTMKMKDQEWMTIT